MTLSTEVIFQNKWRKKSAIKIGVGIPVLSTAKCTKLPIIWKQIHQIKFTICNTSVITIYA